MKKPNITGGKWEAVRNNFYSTVDLEGLSFIDCHCNNITGVSADEAQANAKAISAVPEMIDALMEANDYIIENAPDDIYPERLLDQIEQALIKAGCK